MAKADDPVIRDIQERTEGTVVVLAGEIDYNHSHKLLESLNTLIERRPARLVIDLAQVDHMDSSGLGTLVRVFQQVNGYKGKMALAAMNRRVRNSFEITRLDQFFAIRETVEEALQA
jgi:anti-sigma B factor antagonist